MQTTPTFSSLAELVNTARSYWEPLDDELGGHIAEAGTAIESGGGLYAYEIVLLAGMVPQDPLSRWPPPHLAQTLGQRLSQSLSVYERSGGSDEPRDK